MPTPQEFFAARAFHKNGYSAHAMPEPAVKTKITPSNSKMTMSGMSHHFFSCRANFKKSLRSDHINDGMILFCSKNTVLARTENKNYAQKHSAAQIFHDGFGARMDVKFFIDRPHVT